MAKQQPKNLLYKRDRKGLQESMGWLERCYLWGYESFKDQEFKVNVTERVGNDTWYQGELNGRLIWLPPSDVIETGPLYL